MLFVCSQAEPSALTLPLSFRTRALLTVFTSTRHFEESNPILVIDSLSDDLPEPRNTKKSNQIKGNNNDARHQHPPPPPPPHPHRPHQHLPHRPPHQPNAPPAPPHRRLRNRRPPLPDRTLDLPRAQSGAATAVPGLERRRLQRVAGPTVGLQFPGQLQAARLRVPQLQEAGALHRDGAQGHRWQF